MGKDNSSEIKEPTVNDLNQKTKPAVPPRESIIEIKQS